MEYEGPEEVDERLLAEVIKAGEALIAEIRALPTPGGS
jgi:hypothetical protein